jgi:fatty-acyl-CoA synthase
MESYARGPKRAVLWKSIGESFLETASRFPERFALVSRHQNLTLTWRECAYQARRVAAGLQASGMCPGDRAGLWATTCAEWAIVQFGCALAGVILVNVNPAFRSRERSFVLQKSRMRALFLHGRDRRSNYKLILEESRSEKTPALEHIVDFDTPQWENFLGDPDSAIIHPDPGEPRTYNTRPAPPVSLRACSLPMSM